MLILLRLEGNLLKGNRSLLPSIQIQRFYGIWRAFLLQYSKFGFLARNAKTSIVFEKKTTEEQFGGRNTDTERARRRVRKEHLIYSKCELPRLGSWNVGGKSHRKYHRVFSRDKITKGKSFELCEKLLNKGF